MRKLFGLVTTVVFGSASLFASCADDWLQAQSCCSDDWPSPINVEVGVGYRNDKFSWSIAGPDNTPDILSLLKWEDLRMVEIEGSASYVSCTNYALRISGDYAKIYHGQNTDADFLSDGKRDLFSYSKNNAGKGHVYDLIAGGGYRVMSNCGRFIATPLAGYSWHGQNLHIYDGHQLIDLVSNDVGRIRGLNSHYNARWYGPWVGLDFNTRVECCAYLFGSFEWHFARYCAEGKWNLRRDLGPFRHKANGFGYIAVLGANWEILHNFSIGLMGTYRNFRTHHGHESVTIHDGAESFRVRLHFNKAKWQSASAVGTIAWRF